MARPGACAVLASIAVVLATLPAEAQQLPRRAERQGFDFSPNGVWRRRGLAVANERQAALRRNDLASLNAPQARGPLPGSMALTGTQYHPVFLIQYANTNAGTLRPPAEFQSTLYGAVAPAGRPYTLRTFYEEMSNGVFSVQGTVFSYSLLANSDTYYEGSCNGDVTCAGGGHLAELISEAVALQDAAVDFGQFDNDGVDGIPNSGDDDGYVDVAVFIQPELDGSCGPAATNRNIWPHRFRYNGWVAGSGVVTGDLRVGGGNIRVNDYVIQGAVGGATACDPAQILPVGTIAHEIGHGLGLPDLYDTNPSDSDDSEGIGQWGLMGSGNYTTGLSPSHMEGFSRFQMGWVTVRDLNANGSYEFGPYTTSDTIFRIAPLGANLRGEYYFVENRQAALSDTALVRLTGAGLLIWHFDQVQYDAGRNINRVNSGSIHGLRLMQADGLGNLDTSTPGLRNRGDGGDPYPGTSNNAAFSHATAPQSMLNSGEPSRIAIDSIRALSPTGPMAFRLRFMGASMALAFDEAWDAGTIFMNVARQDTLNVVLFGPDGQTTNWTATHRAAATWNTLTSAAGTGSGQVQWTRNLAGLAAGVYVDTIVVVAANTIGSPAIYFDTLVITGFPATISLATDLPVSGAAGSVQYFRVNPDGGSPNVRFTTAGGTGDVDIYVRESTAPGAQVGQHACRSTTPTSTESCNVGTATGFGYTVMLYGYSAYTGVTLRADADPPPLSLSVFPANGWARSYEVAPTGLGNTTPLPDSLRVFLNGSGGSTTTWTASDSGSSWFTLTTTGGTGTGKVYYTRNPTGLASGMYLNTITITAPGALGSPRTIVDTLVVRSGSSFPMINGEPRTLNRTAGLTIDTYIDVPANSSQLQILLSGGTGNADLYVRRDTLPRLRNSDCYSTSQGNSEGCFFSAPTPGRYYIMLQAATGFSGATLLATFNNPVTVTLSKPAEWHAVPGNVTAVGTDSVSVTLTGTGASSMTWSVTGTALWNNFSAPVNTGSGTGSGKARWTRSSLGLPTDSMYINSIAFNVPGNTKRLIDTLVVASAPAVLSNGSTASGLAGGTGSAQYFVVDVPVGMTHLTATTGGGSGALYLYLFLPQQVTSFQWLAASEVGAQTPQSVTMQLPGGPAPTTVYVMLRGHAGGFDNADLTVTAFTPTLSLASSGRYQAASVALPAATTAESLGVTLTGPASVAWTATHRAAATWNTLTQSAGNGTGWVTWSRNSAGLVAGTYLDTITVTASAGGSPQIHVDTLVIAPAPAVVTSGVPVFNVAGGKGSGQFFELMAPAGTSLVSAVTGGGTGDIQLELALTANMQDFSRACVSQVSGNSENCSSSSPGFASSTPVYVFVKGMAAFTGVTLTATASTPVLAQVSPTSTNDTTAAASVADLPDSASVILTGTGAGTANWNATHGAAATWVTLTTASGTGSGQLRWSRNPAGLAPATYVDTILVTATGSPFAPARLIDTLVILPSPLTLSVSPLSHRVEVITGGNGALPESSSVTLTGSGAAAAVWTATHGSAATWVTLTTAGGTGSGLLRYSRNPSGLAVGVYIDTITVTASGAAGSPQRVMDTLNVLAPLTLAVTPPSRRDSAASGSTGTRSDSADVLLAGTGSAGTPWTATHRAEATWLTLNTAAGTGSGPVRWTRAYSGLAAGTYVDTVTISAAGASGSPARVIDTLVIYTPLTLAVSPPSRKDSTFAGVNGTRTDSVAVQMTGLNAGSSGWSATHRAAATWNSLTTASGTGPGQLRWTRTYNGLAAGTYLDTIRVVVAGAGGSPAIVVDTLVAQAKPVNTAFEVADAILSGGGGALNAAQRNYLDQLGNKNGQFDLGDFLAYVTAFPNSLSRDRVAAVVDVLSTSRPTQSRGNGRARP